MLNGFRALLLAALLMPSTLFAQTTTLAATPPMGWNSWNLFAGRVNDADVRAAADAMVSSGMKDAGYIYVNIDDTWQGERDAQGNIHANSKFPDMKALADYVHSKGLKIGIYSGPGEQTCAKYAGSLGHEAQDAKTYADWGFDYLKYDLCSFRQNMDQEAPNDPAKATQMMKDAYEKMHKALLATGRPIVYSFCQYGWDAVWEWGPSLGANLWRTTGDIDPTWDRMTLIGFSQAGLAKYAGPGHWNDPDMLEVGNGKLTLDENRTHMSLWALLASPLLAGNDLSKMKPETAQILTNREVIAIDQDALGKQGDRVSEVGPVEIWAKPLKGGAKAIGLFNRDDTALPITLKLSDVGFTAGAKARDVWQAKDLGKLQGTYTATVPRHGVALLILTK
jgi:alpha-galactosidase